ncbi:MAG: TerC family protein [Deltaproteobacteria bacterium]|nr:TerC family protein [Deltaproteobacteria bacterium]
MDSIGTPTMWVGFLVFVLAMLALDLGVFHRKSHEISFKEAAIWSSVWVSLSLLFNVGVHHWFGSELALQFLTAYLVEKTLSVDNIFVFVVIFSTLAIPNRLQHRVLFWGILSALVLRAGMIFLGAAMLAKFHWLIYVFGAFLILTGVKLFLSSRKGHEIEPSESRMLEHLRRAIPSTKELHGDSFVTRMGSRWVATPLLMALLLVEVTDLIFALDSIPAVLAISSDTFIVFTSNIFAILGLRSLFFMLSGLVDRFAYLKVGLAAVLVFVGLKMSIVEVVKIPAAASLVVIATLLSVSIGASLWKARRSALPVASAPPLSDA